MLMEKYTFESARKFAQRGIKSETEIRKAIKACKVPGFWSGNRFIIDAEAYITQIKAECLANVKK